MIRLHDEIWQLNQEPMFRDIEASVQGATLTDDRQQVRYHVMRDGGNETIPVPVHAVLGRFRITGVTLVSVEVPADMGAIFYMVTED